MKKASIRIFLILTFGFVMLTLGYFLGKNSNQSQMQVSVSNPMLTEPAPPTQATTQPLEVTEPATSSETTSVPEATEAVTFPININTATQQQLMELPGIGEVLAQRIIDYRENVGPYSAVEQLLNVKGIGAKRLSAILDFVTIGE